MIQHDSAAHLLKYAYKYNYTPNPRSASKETHPELSLWSLVSEGREDRKEAGYVKHVSGGHLKIAVI